MQLKLLASIWRILLLPAAPREFAGSHASFARNQNEVETISAVGQDHCRRRTTAARRAAGQHPPSQNDDADTTPLGGDPEGRRGRLGWSGLCPLAPEAGNRSSGPWRVLPGPWRAL